MTKKFAVTRIVGNDEKVLKVFDDGKQAALAYGADVARANTAGNIVCVRAFFNEENKMDNGQVWIYKVWESDRT